MIEDLLHRWRCPKSRCREEGWLSLGESPETEREKQVQRHLIKGKFKGGSKRTCVLMGWRWGAGEPS